MGYYRRRPTSGTDWGTVETSGSNPLGDNNDGTRKAYFDTGGTIQGYPKFVADTMIPAGRQIIAVKVGHRQVNGGIFSVGNGWPISRLRFGTKRADESICYKQDGFSTSVRQVSGPPLYKPGTAGPGYWTEDEINTISSDIGTNESPAPNRDNKWCIATEVFVDVVYDEPLTAPSPSYPAAGQTISTSSVNFAAVCPAPQAEQPVQAIFQVTQQADFSGDGVSSFIGGLQSSTAADAKSVFTSVKTKGTYTNLGPGLWRMRMKKRDSWGRESGWSATTTFTISHPALPVPSVIAPAPGSTVTTPLAPRAADIPTADTGDRKMGVLFQFSRDNFATIPVAWANVTGGRFDAGTVSYDPKQDSAVGPGLYGSSVSPDDPSQYLAQGTWQARARTVDRWGQFSAWSTVISFTVAHKPVPAPIFPTGGRKFDKDLQLLRWTFTDPWTDDLQSAFQVVVIDPTSQSVLYDSGKVASSVPQAKITLPTPRLQETLSWGVAVWDLDDVKSDTVVSSMVISKAPVITVIDPVEGDQVVSGQPTIQWSAAFARADVTQKSYELVFRDRRTNNVIYQTGKISGTSTSFTPPRVILANLVDVALYLTITDSDDLPNTLIRNFSTNFIRPAEVPSYVDVESFSTNGYATFVYDGAVPDPFFVEWRFYRRPAGLNLPWQLAGTEDDVTVRRFRDWLISGSGEYEFAVTQVATRFGSLVESALPDFSPSYAIRTEHWWLIDTENEANNLRLPPVTDNHFSLKQERKSFVVKGRGTHENRGTKTGKSGSITVAVRASAGMGMEDFMRLVDDIAASTDALHLRDPFGNITKVSLGEMSGVVMKGTGAEFGDVEIPLEEVP